MPRPWIIVVLLSACASEGRLPASYFGERARALQPGHVAVTGAGGAGETGDGSGVGGGGRIRVGVGGNQEVGVEAAEVVLDSPSEHCTSFDCEPGENKRYTVRSVSGLVSWKRQLKHDLALVASAGMARHAWIAGDPAPVGDYKGLSVDGAFGFVESHQMTDSFELYAGVRLATALPIRQDPMLENHTVVGVSSALGGMLRVSKYVDVFAEVGPRGSLIFGGGGITVGGTAVGGLSITM